MRPSRTQQMFAEKPVMSPLGDIFAGAAAGIGNYLDARENANAYNAYFGTSGAKKGTARTMS